MSQLHIVPLSGSTAKVRKALRSGVRAGHYTAHHFGNKTTGYSVVVKQGDDYRVVAHGLADAAAAIAWCNRKMHATPKRLSISTKKAA